MLTEMVSRIFRPRPTTDCSVIEVNRFGDLDRWQRIWSDCYDQTPGATFFQSWLWFETYWRHFGDQQEMRVLVVQGPDGDPIGIVPLTIAVDRRGVPPVRRLGFPLDNWGTSYGALTARPLETFTAAIEHLVPLQSDWDTIDLRWIPSERCEDLRGAFRRAGIRFQQRLWSRTARIGLADGWEHYWNARTSKWRNNLRRSEKGLRQSGEVRFVHFRPQAGETDPRWDLYDLCEQVAAKSWQGACSSGNTLSHPEVKNFLRDVHQRASAAGRVHLSLLFLREEPIAFTYNYLSDGIIHGLRMGYDLRFQETGAGNVLLSSTIQEACRLGDRLFDLGESPSLYKRHWATESFETYRFCHHSLASSVKRFMRLWV